MPEAIRTADELLKLIENTAGDVTFHAAGHYMKDIHLSAIKALQSKLTASEASNAILREALKDYAMEASWEADDPLRYRPTVRGQGGRDLAASAIERAGKEEGCQTK